MRIYVIMLFAVALAAAGAANAQLYRWTDPSGRVHFTDTPPPPNAKNVQKKAGGPGPSQSAPVTPNDPYVVQQARKNSPVTLYTGPGCDPCGSARKLLNERAVPFKEVSVVDEAGAAELNKAVGGGIIPAIVVGKSSQMGFEQAAYHALLDAAGYPRPGILPAKKPEPVVTAPPPPAPRR
jgi:glutaredoxin